MPHGIQSGYLRALILIALAILSVSLLSPVAAQTQDQTDTRISHHTAQLNGVKYHYAIAGSGPAVVLLHGFPATWYEWRHIIPALAATHTVIAPDLRGLGLTARPPTGYDARTVAEDIYRLALHTGHERVYVVGHDIGGWVAFALAHEHPEVVQKLVILDVPIPGAPGLERAPPNAWWPAFHMVPDLPETLVSANVRAYVEYFFNLSAYDPTAVGEQELTEYVRAYSQPGALRAAFAYYRALPEVSRQNEVYARSKLRMPVLALGGETSAAETTLDQLRALGDHVQGGAVQHAGHWIMAEQPEELVRRLREFFADP